MNRGVLRVSSTTSGPIANGSGLAVSFEMPGPVVSHAAPLTRPRKSPDAQVSRNASPAPDAANTALLPAGHASHIARNTDQGLVPLSSRWAKNPMAV